MYDVVNRALPSWAVSELTTARHRGLKRCGVMKARQMTAIFIMVVLGKVDCVWVCVRVHACVRVCVCVCERGKEGGGRREGVERVARERERERERGGGGKGKRERMGEEMGERGR